MITEPGAFEPKPEVCGYHQVRAAAKDYRTYSSDLTGDTDVRTYRHLPLEADPPRHTKLRLAIQPMFSEEFVGAHSEDFRRVATEVITAARDRSRVEIGADVALPVVMGCLVALYSRPQDLTEWISWGPTVWHADAFLAGEQITADTKRSQRDRDYTVPQTQRSANVIDSYLMRVFDEAEADPNTDPATMDAWDFISAIEIDGQPLTRQEKMGMASVLLAGGRDTVIKLITGLIWHLIRNPQDRKFLTEHPQARPAAIAELARFFSPLPRMERIVKDGQPTEACPAGRDGGYRVILSYVSANFDRAVWSDAEELNIRREQKPNVAFGFGRHSCLGLKVTEHETAAFLDVLLADWPQWQFDGEPELAWFTIGVGTNMAEVIDEFESVRVMTESVSAVAR